MKSKQVQLINNTLTAITVNDFTIVEVDIPTLEEGDILVKNYYCGTDPYMRPAMYPMKPGSEDTGISAHIKPMTAIYGDSVGVVVESKNSLYKQGEIVYHKQGWREYSVLNSNVHTIERVEIDPDNDPVKHAKEYLLSYGVAGKAAYYSAAKVLGIQAGETVCVSGAMGAVGHLFIQYAKLMGATVYGITSTQEKSDHIKQLGGIPIIVPKKTTIQKKSAIIAGSIPGSFDKYHENVGNDYFTIAEGIIKENGILCYCGAMSVYNNLLNVGGPSLFPIIYKEFTIKGCNFNRDSIWIEEYTQFLHKNKENITRLYTVYDGIETMPQQFVDQFYNFESRLGKSVCKI